MRKRSSILLQGTARLADEVGVHSHYIPLAGVERQTFKESLWRLHSIDGWPEAKSQVRAQGLLYNRFEPERGHTDGFSPSWGSLTGSGRKGAQLTYCRCGTTMSTRSSGRSPKRGGNTAYRRIALGIHRTPNPGGESKEVPPVRLPGRQPGERQLPTVFPLERGVGTRRPRT